MERLIKTITKHRQILVNFLGGDFGIPLSSDYVRMSQNPAYTLDGDSLA